MTMSPDEETVVSIGADETLRFWKCFAADQRAKKSKDANKAEMNSASLNSGFGRCIR